jgi:hypothetical protein
MEPHKIKPTDGKQDGPVAVADGGRRSHISLHLMMKL